MSKKKKSAEQIYTAKSFTYVPHIWNENVPIPKGQQPIFPKRRRTRWARLREDRPFVVRILAVLPLAGVLIYFAMR